VLEETRWEKDAHFEYGLFPPSVRHLHLLVRSTYESERNGGTPGVESDFNNEEQDDAEED
jgi:hypothetical protein